MATTEYKNDFIESYVQAGAVADAAEKLLKVLDAHGLKPTEAQRAQVVGCTDKAQLDLWFDRALTAQTAADVFKE